MSNELSYTRQHSIYELKLKHKIHFGKNQKPLTHPNKSTRDHVYDLGISSKMWSHLVAFTDDTIHHQKETQRSENPCNGFNITRKCHVVKVLKRNTHLFIEFWGGALLNSIKQINNNNKTKESEVVCMSIDRHKWRRPVRFSRVPPVNWKR